MSENSSSDGSEPRRPTDKRNIEPPRFAKWILEKFTPSSDKQTISGDLEEYFHEIRAQIRSRT